MFNSIMIIRYNIILQMGQCNLSEIETNYFGDLFNSQASEEGSSISKENISQKDRIMWQHELNISHRLQITDKSQFNQNSTIYHPCFPQISKDVTRTFPESSFFGNKNNLDKFERVLSKLALYLPHVGYTQGLNFVCGFLLLSGCQQEQCFNILQKWMLHDRILAIGLYEDGFPLNKLYCQVFWIILQKKLPKIYQKLKRISLLDQLWIFQWFITLFFYNFSLDLSRRIWDFIISKKEFGAVLVAFGIIKTLKNQIAEMKLDDQVEFFQYVSQFRDPYFCKTYLNANKIFSYANSITKIQLEKAILQTKCGSSNYYKVYFTSSLSNQKELWFNLIKKLQNQRSAFNMSNEPQKYQRTADIIENIEKLVLSKYKLYQSDMKKSNGLFRKSNFSNPFSVRSCKTNKSKSIDFNKKRIV